jgi:hypothetical protein
MITGILGVNTSRSWDAYRRIIAVTDSRPLSVPMTAPADGARRQRKRSGSGLAAAVW